MNTEKLNQMLVDRAVGELPADVTELLDAYLAHDAPSAGRMSEIRETVGLARQVLAASVPETGKIQPFPSARIAAARNRRRMAGWVRPLALAACIVLAFLSGTRWNRAPQPLDARALALAAADVSGFWMVSSRRTAAIDRQTSEFPKVRWSSPLRWPQVGGQS